MALREEMAIFSEEKRGLKRSEKEMKEREKMRTGVCEMGEVLPGSGLGFEHEEKSPLKKKAKVKTKTNSVGHRGPVASAPNESEENCG